MNFFRWLGGFIIFFYLMGLFFKIGGSIINLLLVSASIIFIIDAILGRKKIM